MTPPKAFLLPCGTRFRHQRDMWSIEEPLSRLDHWIAFYKRMAAKRPRVYGPDYAALRLLKTEVSR